jgi:hypothetical protein
VIFLIEVLSYCISGVLYLIEIEMSQGFELNIIRNNNRGANDYENISI